jgi:hypothetical protein
VEAALEAHFAETVSILAVHGMRSLKAVHRMCFDAEDGPEWCTD